MPDMQAITGALGGLKAAGELIKALSDVQGAIKEQGKVFELQRVIIAAHESALGAQEAQSALLARIRELEKQIGDFETWEGEKQRYELRDISQGRGGVFAYALKTEAQGTEPFHLLCAKCFEHRKKSILQATPELRMRLRVHVCPECKSEFVFAHVPEAPRVSSHETRYNPFRPGEDD